MPTPTIAPQLTTSLSGHFALRLAIATSLAAFAGGTSTAFMFIAMGESDGSPGRSFLGLVPALVALAIVVWWLVCAHAPGLRTPSNRKFAQVAIVAGVIALASQVWAEVGLADGRVTVQNAGVVSVLMVVGAFFALVPAGVCLAVLAGLVYGLRSAGRRISTTTTQVLSTVLATAVTAAYTWLFMHTFPGYTTNELLVTTALAGVLAGACAAIAVRWSLSYRRV